MWHSALPLTVQEPRDQVASPESISQGKEPEVSWGTDKERDPTRDRQLHVFLLSVSLQASFPDSFESLPPKHTHDVLLSPCQSHPHPQY